MVGRSGREQGHSSIRKSGKMETCDTRRTGVNRLKGGTIVNDSVKEVGRKRNARARSKKNVVHYNVKVTTVTRGLGTGTHHKMVTRTRYLHSLDPRGMICKETESALLSTYCVQLPEMNEEDD